MIIDPKTLTVQEELDLKLTPEQVQNVLLKCLANLVLEDDSYQAVTWNCWDEPKDPARDFYSDHCARYVLSNFYAIISSINTMEFALLRAVRDAEAQEAKRQEDVDIEAYLLSM